MASANFLGGRCGHFEDVLVNLQSYIYLYSMDNLLARRLRRWGWGIGIATVVIVVVLALAGAYMIDYSLFPKMRHGHNLPWRLDNIISESP